MKKTLSLLTAVFCLFHFSACATIVSGKNSPLLIRSEPVNAEVKIDGVFAGRTPLYADIRRIDNHDIRVSKPGYSAANLMTGRKLNAWSAGNVIFGLFGILGVFVDASTGALFSPKSDELFIKLAPKENAAPVPSREETLAEERALRMELRAQARAAGAVTKGDPGFPAAKLSRFWEKTKDLTGTAYRFTAAKTKTAVRRLKQAGNGNDEDGLSPLVKDEKSRARSFEPAINPAADEEKTSLRKKDHPFYLFDSGVVPGFIANLMRGFANLWEKEIREIVSVPEELPLEPPAPVESAGIFEAPASEFVYHAPGNGSMRLAESPATAASLAAPAYQPPKMPAAGRRVEPRAAQPARPVETPLADSLFIVPEREPLRSQPLPAITPAAAADFSTILETPLVKADIGMLKGGPMRPAMMVSRLVDEEPSAEFETRGEEEPAPFINAAEPAAQSETVPGFWTLQKGIPDPEPGTAAPEALFEPAEAEEMILTPGGSTFEIQSWTREENNVRELPTEPLTDSASGSLSGPENRPPAQNDPAPAKTDSTAYGVVKII